MQKVESSSLFIRFQNFPKTACPGALVPAEIAPRFPYWR